MVGAMGGGGYGRDTGWWQLWQGHWVVAAVVGTLGGGGYGLVAALVETVGGGSGGSCG